MASRFQSRLVGTIILVALGVIILPDLLDGKKSHYQDDIAAIPLKPESQIDIQALEVPEPKVDNSELPQAPVSAVIEEPSAPVDVQTEERQTAQNWDVIQLKLNRLSPVMIISRVPGSFS